MPHQDPGPAKRQAVRRLVFAGGLALLVACAPLAAFADLRPVTKATTTGDVDLPIKRLNLNVPIPGLELASNLKVVDGYISVPYLAQYISAVYKYLIGISVVAASVMIVYAGFLYVTSPIGSDIKHAKQMILDSIVGLCLLMGVSTVINFLSPEAFDLVPLRVNYVTPKELEMFNAIGTTSPYSDPADPNTNAPPSTPGEPDPNFKPPEGCIAVKPAAAANSYGRMMQSCQGKSGSQEDLVAVVKAWKSAGIDDMGSVYGWGGYNGGKKVVLGSSVSSHSIDVWINTIRNTSYLSGDLRSKCGLPDGSLTAGNVENAIEKNPSAECGSAAFQAYDRYMGAVKCNNIFAGDCVTTVDQMLGCARVPSKGGKSASQVRVMAAQAKVTADDIKNGNGIFKADNGVIFALDKAAMIRAKQEGLIHFGAPIGVRCGGHFIMYVGNADLGYDIIQTGDAGGIKPGSKAAPNFPGNGAANDVHNYGMSTVTTLEAYVNLAPGNCRKKAPSDYYFYNNF